MIIDIENIEEKKIDNFKGGDGYTKIKAYEDEKGNKIMRVTLDSGCSIGYHKHIGNAEIVYIIEGTITCNYENEEFTFTKGQVHYCQEGHSHSMKNNTNSPVKMFCVVPLM